jgi:uncharacterized C2H2 Zn-finger protein
VYNSCESERTKTINRNGDCFYLSMQNGERKLEEHFMRCPDCGDVFDMRDLKAVFDHEHWMAEKLNVSFSHVKKLGRENEVYVKAGARMVTLKQQKQNR